MCCFDQGSTWGIFTKFFRHPVFAACHNFLWTLWVFQGERATSDVGSWAHLINKWINYARFMGWCTSKHFKGHAECPWGAVMRVPQRSDKFGGPTSRAHDHFLILCVLASIGFLLSAYSLSLTSSHSTLFFFLSWPLISPQVTSFWSRFIYAELTLTTSSGLF